MEKIRVIEVKKSVYASNDEEARKYRAQYEASQTFLMNLMSSPGSGKTTFLSATLNQLKHDLAIGVVEADIDSDVDAYTIQKTGVKVNQIHSGGMCHLDATMVKEGLDDIGYQDLDLVVVENIGNLICPASYDLGQHLNTMILSVPEGDDKPLKYPKMFKHVDVLIVSKIDACSLFDFDFKALEERVKKLNPTIKIFPLSAKSGEGVETWSSYLKTKIIEWRNSNGA